MTRTEFHLYYIEVMNDKPVWTRFYHCQAWVSDAHFGVRLVKSYDTVVGIIKDNILWWERKYSRTTSKQLTLIANYYNLTKQQTEAI